MLDSLPQWTEFHDAELGGRDPLGLDRVNQRVLDRVLPSVTTQTPRARYYSAYAWIIDDVRTVVPQGDRRAFTTEFQRREAMLALACLAHHEEDEPPHSIAGAREAKARFGGSKGPYSVREPLLKEALGGFGSYYRAAMERTGLCERGERGTAVTAIGARLAAAFRANISATTYAKKKLSDGEALKRGVLDELAPKVCLCALDESSAERRLLTEVLLDGAGGREHQRSTFRWLLEVADALEGWDLEGLALEDVALRWMAHRGELPDGTPWAPADRDAFVVDTWRCFQANAYFAFFLESLAAAVAGHLTTCDGGRSVADLGSWVAKAVGAPKALAPWTEAGEHERDLYREMVPDRLDGAATTANAVRGLFALYRRHRAEKGAAWSNLRALAAGDIWLGDFTRLVDEALSQGEKQLLPVLTTTLRRLVFDQHERVVYGDRATLDGLVFSTRGDLITAEQGIDVSRPSTRLPCCVSILRDLGLVGPKGAPGLTPDGKRKLEQMRRDHV